MAVAGNSPPSIFLMQVKRKRLLRCFADLFNYTNESFATDVLPSLLNHCLREMALRFPV